MDDALEYGQSVLGCVLVSIILRSASGFYYAHKLAERQLLR